MEDTLREKKWKRKEEKKLCLNPCCNGRYSQREAEGAEAGKPEGLNPCCNGRYSQRDYLAAVGGRLGRVLILVVMEDTLRGIASGFMLH